MHDTARRVIALILAGVMVLGVLYGAVVVILSNF